MYCNMKIFLSQPILHWECMSWLKDPEWPIPWVTEVQWSISVAVSNRNALAILQPVIAYKYFNNSKFSRMLASTVYRKPTHTDRYLHFKSHHPNHVKRGVVRCLYQIARRVNRMAAVTSIWLIGLITAGDDWCKYYGDIIVKMTYCLVFCVRGYV